MIRSYLFIGLCYKLLPLCILPHSPLISLCTSMSLSTHKELRSSITATVQDSSCCIMDPRSSAAHRKSNTRKLHHQRRAPTTQILHIGSCLFKRSTSYSWGCVTRFRPAANCPLNCRSIKFDRRLWAPAAVALPGLHYNFPKLYSR